MGSSTVMGSNREIGRRGEKAKKMFEEGKKDKFWRV